MNFADYKQKILTCTDAISHIEKIATCLICCNRLAPLYAEFTRREDWGDETHLSQCRTESLDYLRSKRRALSISHSALEPFIPHTENFGSLLGSFAVNCGVAHLHLIEQFTEENSAPLQGALAMCYETVDFCVQSELDPHCTRSVPLPEIDAHAMMRLEVDWQFKTLGRIQGNSDLVGFVTTESHNPTLAQFLLDTATQGPAAG